MGLDILGKKDISRLKAEIKFYLKRLDCLEREDHPPDDNWSDDARDLLESARKALEEGHKDLSWRYLDSAKSFIFLGMNDEVDKKAEAQAIINEAEDPDKKVSEWRKKTIKDNLCPEGKLKEGLKGRDLFNASAILFENKHNRYIKMWRIQRLLKILTIALFSAILILVWIVPPLFGKIVIDNAISDIDRIFVLSVVLFGILGASISGILTVARSGVVASIPDQLIDFWILLAKLVVGAASALVVFAFILSGILSYKAEAAQIMAISFVAGFSERLVTSAIESVTKK